MRAVKILLAVVAAIIVLDVSLSSTLSYYDARTKQKLLLLVAQELRPHASNEEMVNFMRRHTARYAFDEKYHHEYAGFIPQTKLDRMLFDRKAQLVLKVDQNNNLTSAEARIYYTWL